MKRTQFGPRKKWMRRSRKPIAQSRYGEIGEVFNRKMILRTHLVHGSICLHCGGRGTDAAHILGLGGGRSRKNAHDRRNHSPNRCVLCRPCHRGQTGELGVGIVWTFEIDHREEFDVAAWYVGDRR